MVKAAAAPTQAVATEAPASKTFRTGAVGRFNTLDVANITTVAEKMILSNLVDTLFQRSAQTGEIVPRACDRFEISPDGMRIKMVLRKDLFWSDGKRIKARDYEAALRRLLKPKTKAVIAKKLSVIKGAQEMLDGAFYNPDDLGVSSVDLMSQSELTITLDKPNPLFIQVLADPSTAPIPAETYEDRQDEIFKAAHYVSSGPFVITKKSPNSYALKKNRHHRYASNIQLDEVVFYIFNSVAEAEKMFLSGLIDFFGYPDAAISEDTIASLAGTGYVGYQPDLRTVFVRLNTTQVPLSQFQLRQALAMSLNHNRLMSSVAIWGEKKAESLVPESVKFYDAPHGYYSNEAAGKEILTNHGFCEKGNCETMPRMTVLYPETLAMKKIALQLSTQLKQTLSTSQIQTKSLDIDNFVTSVGKNDFVMALDEIAVGPDEVFGFLHAFVSGNPLSGGYSNPDYDRLIQQALSSGNVADMKKYYREAESMLLRDVIVIPILFKTTPFLLHKRVGGFMANVWNVHPFESIYIK